MKGKLKEGNIGPRIINANIKEAMGFLGSDEVDRIISQFADIYNLKNTANKQNITAKKREMKDELLKRVNKIGLELMEKYIRQHPDITPEKIREVPLFHNLKYFIYSKSDMERQGMTTTESSTEQSTEPSTESSTITSRETFDADRVMSQAKDKIDELESAKVNKPAETREEIKEQIEELKDKIEDVKEAKREGDAEDLRDEIKDIKEELIKASELIEEKKAQPPPRKEPARDFTESEKPVIRSLYGYFKKLVGDESGNVDDFKNNRRFMRVYNEAMKVYRHPERYYSNTSGSKTSFIDVFKAALRLDTQRKNKKYSKITKAINSEVKGKQKTEPVHNQKVEVNDKGEKVMTGTVSGDLKTSRSGIPYVKDPEFVEYKIVF